MNSTKYYFQLKEFLKKCKSANYCKVIKGLLDKIQENCKIIEERRKNIQFSIKDKKNVVCICFYLVLQKHQKCYLTVFFQAAWIENNRKLGTPLSQWYTRYKTLREREIMMAVSNKENVN